MMSESILYQITDQEWSTPDGHRWGPGTLCNARPESTSTGWIRVNQLSEHLNKPKKLKLIPGYRHSILASLLFRAHISIDSPVLWESRGEVVEESVDGRVYCEWMRPKETVRLPKISDYTRMKFGFGAVSKVYKDPKFQDYILDWIGGDARESGRAKTFIESTRKDIRKDENGYFADGESVAAFAANWMCYAAQTFSDINAINTGGRLVETWTANAAVEANRAAFMMKKNFSLENIAELVMTAR